MNSAPAQWVEADRIAALESYGILDTPEEKDFDDVVKLVCQLLDVPVAAVNLIADQRQWFKSEIGLGVREMPLDDSICKFALLADGPMIVPDTRDDPRFACNPLVTGNPGLRFYAGAQLMTPEGFPLGTLCALGFKERPEGLSEQQTFILTTLARQIMSQLELRRVMRQQQDLLVQQARTQQALLAADQKKNEFLAVLAHELRNPLAPIASAADLLTMSEEPSTIRKASAIIARQARHMNGLIEDLLDASRVAQGKVALERAEVDLRDIAGNAVEQVRPLVDRYRHRLSVQVPPTPAWTTGDPKRLVQVVTNLLSNAAKYTPDGGAIKLEISTDDMYHVVSVRDDGIGMTPELLESAFQLFSQAESSLARSQGGLGIGLALVKSLVSLHEGSIVAESEGPDRGSRFVVRLPRTGAGLHDCPEPPSDAFATAGQGLRIAIVDDNEDAATMLAMYLESVGHEVMTLHSARAAIDAIPAWRPDVGLLDIGLPDIDGHELARRLRGHPAIAGCVLLAVTGYGKESDRQQALAAGFDALFVKPVDLQDLQRWLADIDTFQALRAANG